MELSPLAIIGIGLATMFFGYFFGLFEGRGQGYKRRAKEEPLGALAPPLPQKHPTTSSETDKRTLLSLRLGPDGRAVVHIDGEQVAASNVTPGLRKRLIDLMVMLRPWVEPALANSRTPDRLGDETPSAVPRTATPASTPPAVQISPGSGTPAVVGAPAPPAALSLVQQIDAVLQARLAGTPLANRGIRLAESLRGGAIVFIGQTQYEGVDQVPDAEIQSAIRTAIAEWEKRFTPG